MFLWVWGGFFGLGLAFQSRKSHAWHMNKKRLEYQCYNISNLEADTGSLQLAATAEKGTFDSELADYINFCGNSTQSLLKLWGKKYCRHLLQYWQWLD